MLLRTGRDLVWLLKILPSFDYVIVLVLLLLFVKTVLLAMARLANCTSPPRAQKKEDDRSLPCTSGISFDR
jgi:hypothetical protein